MNRAFATAAGVVAFSALVFSQGYQPGPYAPRQPYPARPLTPYRNPALTNSVTNYYPQRPGLPGARPYFTNTAPGALPNRYAPQPGPTNYWPGARYAPNFAPGNRFATNAPANRFAPNPYSFTNVMPRVGYGTNAARFAPTMTNFPGYRTSTTNAFFTNGQPGSNSFASPPGTTNFLLPNSTNAQSRQALTPAQRQHIDRLTLVFHGIKNSPVTSSQRQQILNALQNSIPGLRYLERRSGLGGIPPAPPPSAESLSKLVDDLAAAWPGKAFTYQQKFQLAVDLNRVLTSANLTEGEVLVVVNDARRVLQQAGVNEESRNALIDDLNAIAAQVQKPSPKAPQETAAAPETGK